MRGGRGALCLCNKTCARFYLLVQRVFYIKALGFLLDLTWCIWRHLKESRDPNEVRCKLSGGFCFRQFPFILLHCIGLSIRRKSTCFFHAACHVAAFSLSWEPAPKCPELSATIVLICNFEIQSHAIQVCPLHWAEFICPQVEMLVPHTESTLCI